MSNIKVFITDTDQATRAKRSGGAEVLDAREVDGRALSIRIGRCAACALLLILVSYAGAKADAAISLAEYRARVERAAIALDSLTSFDEELSEKKRAEQISSTLNDVRKSIPPALAVQWNGAPMQVNNSWLDEALKEYEGFSTPNVRRGSGDDDTLARTRRSRLLASITERLHALTERLDEILKPSAATRSKDEEKARLAAILRRPEYNKAAQESALSRLWERIKRWLRNLFPEREPQQVEGRRIPFLTKLVEFFVIALAVAAIAYAVWKFLPRFLRNRGGRRREKREARVVLGERLAPDQTAFDILSEAERLARAGDIRGAIRKGYIAILCELGDRKILSLAQHKTNRDYLRALSERRPLYGEMQVLTNSFENHWYGYAPGTENDWTDFRMHYQRALENQ